MGIRLTPAIYQKEKVQVAAYAIRDKIISTPKVL